MRALPLLAGASLALLLAAAACDDATKPPFLPEGSPTATAQATPTAPATPTPEARDFPGFKAFATKIVQRARLEEVVCEGGEELGPCAGHAPGRLIGVPGGVWQSDAFAVFPPDEYAASLERYFEAGRGDLRDEYGGGSLTLYALAYQGEVDGADVFQAITTSMVDTYPTGYPIGETQREAHAFRFRLEDGDWRFAGETVAVMSPSAGDWLSGNCTDCYDQWERWEGIP